MFKDLFNLDSRIAVYVPSTTDADNDADSDDVAAAIDSVLTEFSRWFGGATVQRAVGSWLSDEHGLIKEDVAIVYAFADADDVAAHESDVIAIAERIRDEFSQEAVAIEHDGRLYFVS